MTIDKAIAILDCIAAGTLDKYSFTESDVSDAIDFMENTLERSKTLLEATYNLLNKQCDSPYVLNLISETIDYDDAECDGMCLMEDINYWFFDADGRYLDEI